MRGLAVVMVAGALAAFSAGAQAQTSPPGPPADTSPTATPQGAGANLYLRDCAWCHGTRLEGTARGPSLIGTGEAANRFYLTTGRMPISDPAEPIRRRPPAYTPAEIRVLVDYLRATAGGPPSPAVDPSAGDLAAGGELYRLHCGACHGATGAGFPLLRGRSSPPMWHATPAEVAEAIRIGPGGMPVFSPETLTDEEVNSIVRYVVYLQDPHDRGGLHLFRIGPIAEGAVAWLLGIGLLLFTARLLGERT